MLAPHQNVLEVAAWRLRQEGLSYGEIAVRLDINAIHARDLALRHERRMGSRPRRQWRLRRKTDCGLSKRALTFLLGCTHAARFAATMEGRQRCLAEIAASYRKAEMLAEANAGPVTVREIEIWLESQGRSLKPPIKWC
ncbi:MAG: hypothetical protein K0S00_1843 [Xanthobacteraceae bacterium]|jgi:hypothetical protein|nr:hypothetical protein [Xanthobacteraceae bacterium]